jgi:hypothetical protein
LLTLLASTVQMLVLAQYHMIVIGGPDQFPRSVFAVFAILIAVTTFAYRLVFWIPLRFGLKIKNFGKSQLDAMSGREFQLGDSERAETEKRISELFEAGKSWQQSLSALKTKLNVAQLKKERLDVLASNSAIAKSGRIQIRRELLRETSKLTMELMSSRIALATTLLEIFPMRRIVQKDIQKVQQRLSIFALHQQLGDEFVGPTDQLRLEELNRQAEKGASDLALLEYMIRLYYEDLLSIPYASQTFTLRAALKAKEKAAWAWLLIEIFACRRLRIPYTLMEGLKSDPATLLAGLSALAILAAASLVLTGMDFLVETLANVAFLSLILGAAICLYKYALVKNDKTLINDESSPNGSYHIDDMHHRTARPAEESIEEIYRGKAPSLHD